MTGQDRQQSAHFFENDGQLKMFLSDISTGEVSLKWAYTGSAAATHDQLGKSEGYNANSDASSLEAQLLEQLVSPPMSVVDIGPGNSFHTATLWTRIAVERRPKRYLLLDFSRDLMRICQERLVATDGSLAKSAIDAWQWDFESGPTDQIEHWRTDHPLLILLIGHTSARNAGLDEALVQARATEYASRMKSHSLGSIRDVTQIFEFSGWQIVDLEEAEVKGELTPTTYARIVARSQ